MQRQIDDLNKRVDVLEHAEAVAGPQGPKGDTGATGAVGPKGEGVLPSERRQFVDDLELSITHIYSELDVQMKRMAQIQSQLDSVRKRLKALAEV